MSRYFLLWKGIQCTQFSLFLMYFDVMICLWVFTCCEKRSWVSTLLPIDHCEGCERQGNRRLPREGMHQKDGGLITIEMGWFEMVINPPSLLWNHYDYEIIKISKGDFIMPVTLYLDDTNWQSQSFGMGGWTTKGRFTSFWFEMNLCINIQSWWTSFLKIT